MITLLIFGIVNFLTMHVYVIDLSEEIKAIILLACVLSDLHLIFKWRK